MQFILTELKEQEPWLRQYHSKMLQMICHKIASARKTLVALRKNGFKVGKMCFIGREDYNSFVYNQSGFMIERHGNTDLLWLSKIGYIEIRLHRPVQDIKQVILKRETSNKWYAVITCELSRSIFRFISMSKSVGIDVGITKFCHDSDDNAVKNPLYLNKTIKRLRRASRRLSRKQKDSKNIQKAKKRLQILHEKIRNQ